MPAQPDANVPHALFPTPLGTCGIAWNDVGLTGVQLPEADEARTEQRLVRSSGSEARAVPPPWVDRAICAVRSVLEGKEPDLAGLRFDWSRVGPFRRRVYEASLEVRFGHTCSYGELARRLGLPPGAARSIGQAMGSNPWVILVPCHRIVGAGGKLVGFSAGGGTDTKARLLAIEGLALPL